MELPVKFREKMKELLNDEFESFLNSYEKPHFRGVRLNTLKCDEETLRKSLPFELSASPFSPLSFYGAEEKVGALAAHHAGMFYSQEPSASSAVTVLDPQKGEKVLDLCAAPGGKSTQIAALLDGEGLLWSNEIVKNRANILLSNMERMGVRNAVVSSCHPQKLCESLQGYFDRVLVDAPCSGEGMFRRDPEAVNEWSQEAVVACAQRQRTILNSAALAVKEDGILVYSTCTFSKEENEETVTAFLTEHPEFEQLTIDVSFGRAGFDGLSRRIFPMDGGEGHFIAKFRRKGNNFCSVKSFNKFMTSKESKPARELYSSLFTDICPEKFALSGDKILILPGELPELSALGVLRAGVELGEMRNGRIEPSHSLFMSSKKACCKNAADFEHNSEKLAAFLRGEEIDCDNRGYTAVCVNGVVTGFGKASNGRLKNRYPKGLRNKT